MPCPASRSMVRTWSPSSRPPTTRSRAPAGARARHCSRSGRSDTWATRCRMPRAAPIAARRNSSHRASAIPSCCSRRGCASSGCSTTRGSVQSKRTLQRKSPTRSNLRRNRRNRRRISCGQTCMRRRLTDGDLSIASLPRDDGRRCDNDHGDALMAVLTYRDALNAALREEMQRDDNVFLLGEEVAEYDGAYKVSRGLLKEFGARRVVDTPIAELGFTGIGVGAAMVGLRPVIEMMTMNFALLAIDQIVNTAAKVRYMSGGQIGCPLVIRGPGGAALQLGAQHSQAFESWYANIPGLKVVMPATPADAKGLLKSAIRDDNPVIFIEGEMLYNQKGEVPDGEHLIPLGRADIKRPGNDVTIICHSKTVAPAMNAAKSLADEGVDAEVVDLRTIRPLDQDAILASVAKTHRV